MATAKKKKGKRGKKPKRGGERPAPKTVPRRESSESLVAYHDRLSALASQALEASDKKLSTRLQKKAGKIASEHPEVARRSRTGKEPRSGPGTYPWDQCRRDQLARGYDRERANAICGRIRANSKARYPAYWGAREAPTANPAPEVHRTPGEPYVALALDAGPRFDNPSRDLVVVFDCDCRVLDVCPILGDHSLGEFDSKYPGLPIIGRIPVLASYPREIVRAHERGPTRVETRRRTK